jgi:hypothetical protein
MRKIDIFYHEVDRLLIDVGTLRNLIWVFNELRALKKKPHDSKMIVIRFLISPSMQPQQSWQPQDPVGFTGNNSHHHGIHPRF